MSPSKKALSRPRLIEWFLGLLPSPDRQLPVCRQPLFLPAAPKAVAKAKKVDIDVFTYARNEFGWVNRADIAQLKTWAAGIAADHIRFDSEIPYDLTEILSRTVGGNKNIMDMYQRAKDTGPIEVAEVMNTLMNICDIVLEQTKSWRGTGTNSQAHQHNRMLLEKMRQAIESPTPRKDISIAWQESTKE